MGTDETPYRLTPWVCGLAPGASWWRRDVVATWRGVPKRLAERACRHAEHAHDRLTAAAERFVLNEATGEDEALLRAAGVHVPERPVTFTSTEQALFDVARAP